MARSVFQHVDAIYNDQSLTYFDELEDADRKSFNNYMVNRIISMNMDYLPVVSEVQKYYEVIGERELYLFYSQLLPKKKQFNKYIKKSSGVKYEKWVVELVRRYYKLNMQEAEQNVHIMCQTDEGKKELLQILKAFGSDEKAVKKLKLST